MTTLNEARRHAAAGNLPAADAAFRTLHNPAAPDPLLLIEWSRLRRQANDPQNAMAMLQAAANAGGGPRVLIDMGSLLLDLGRTADAAPLLRQAAAQGKGLALDFELARLDAAEGRLDQAATRFRAVMKAEPAHIAARLGLARAYRALNRIADAIASYEALLRRAPNTVPAMQELAFLHGAQRNFPASLALYDRLEKLGVDVAQEMSAVALALMHMGDWSRRAELRTRLAARMARPEPCVVEAYAFLAADDDPRLHARVGAHFAQAIANVTTMRKACAPRAVGPADRRLRIGYLCGDFNQHATSLLLAGVLEAHDRNHFEITAYDYSPEDGSPTRARMVAAFEHFTRIHDIGPQDAADRIAADEIDILIDLKGYTERTRTEITALRPAPIQAQFLGYVGTTAAPWIDYVLADSVVLPEEEFGNWSEKAVYMPHSYYPNDRSRPRPEPDTDRAAHGLPAEGTVLACFNNPFKISPEIFAAWMEILKQEPNAVLWLYEGNEFIAGNLRREAEAAGIDRARLIFAPPAPLDRHLARLPLADLFLDTIPYGAHTTGADALWAGVPMLTCTGRSWASRVGASLLHAVGLPELITASLDEYKAAAGALIHDAERRTRLRTHLLAARDTAPLFDAPAFARALEAAYTRMAERHRAGENPVPFAVQGEAA